MEKKIFEILEKMKLEVITLDEAQKQLCVLFGVIQRSEQSSKIVNGKCMMCGDVADTKDGWICADCRKF
jgi:hypothetical protein